MLLWFPIVLTLIVVFLLIKILRPLAMRRGLVDLPNARKLHRGAVPLIGGICLYLGFLAGFFSLPFSISPFRSFITASSLLVLVGLLDDFYDLSPRFRLCIQILAGLLMATWGEISLWHLGNLFFFRDIGVGMLGIPLTVIAVVVVINAFNMLDGVDGLAGLISIITLLFLISYGLERKELIKVEILALLCAGLFSFLWFNFPLVKRPKALVFLGDAGSMWIGFVLVWFLIDFSNPKTNCISPVALLWLLTIPLFDFFGVIFYRIRHKKPIFHADREHFHYVLLDLGFSKRQLLGIMGTIALLGGMVSLLIQANYIHETIGFWGFFLSFIVYIFVLQVLRKSRINEKTQLG